MNEPNATRLFLRRSLTTIMSGGEEEFPRRLEKAVLSRLLSLLAREPAQRRYDLRLLCHEQDLPTSNILQEYLETLGPGLVLFPRLGNLWQSLASVAGPTVLIFYGKEEFPQRHPQQLAELEGLYSESNDPALAPFRALASGLSVDASGLPAPTFANTIIEGRPGRFSSFSAGSPAMLDHFSLLDLNANAKPEKARRSSSSTKGAQTKGPATLGQAAMGFSAKLLAPDPLPEFNAVELSRLSFKAPPSRCRLSLAAELADLVAQVLEDQPGLKQPHLRLACPLPAVTAALAREFHERLYQTRRIASFDHVASFRRWAPMLSFLSLLDEPVRPAVFLSLIEFPTIELIFLQPFSSEVAS